MGKLKTYDYYVPLYGKTLKVFFGRANWNTALKKFNLEDTPEMVAGVFEADGNLYAGFLNPKRVRGEVIAHECVHLTNLIHNNAGVKNDSFNDEPYAYMVQNLYGIIEEALERYNKKRKK